MTTVIHTSDHANALVAGDVERMLPFGWHADSGLFYSQGSVDGEVNETSKKISGTAWTFNKADRNRRRHLPGSFGEKAFTVPLLAYHDDTRPIGSSKMTPDAKGLRFAAAFVDGLPSIDEIRTLVKEKAIPGVSIGWTSVDGLLPRWEDIGPDPAEPDRPYFDEKGFLVFPKSDVIEMSVTPIPAHPRALIQVAALLPHKDAAEEIIELFSEAAKRHRFFSHAKAGTHVQSAHDALVRAGANCKSGEEEPDDEEAAVDDELVATIVRDADIGLLEAGLLEV